MTTARRRGRLVWLWLAAALAWVPARPVEAIGPTLIGHVDAFSDAPCSLFGRTRGEVEQRLGQPLAVHARPARGAPEGRVAGSVAELAYPGLVIRIHPAIGVEHVEVTAPTHGLPWGLAIGASHGQVERALGQPQELSDAGYMYAYSDAVPNTVHFDFRDDRVYRLERHDWVTFGFQPR